MSDKQKIQEVTLTFTNGSKATFIGPAIVGIDKMEDLELSPKNPIQISPPRDLTDEIRKEILNDTE